MDSSLPGARVYRPILAEPDWIYAKYLGWAAVVEKPGFRLLTRRLGPIRRFLALSFLPKADLEEEIAKANIFGGLVSVSVKDFTAEIDELDDAAHPFVEASASERMLNRHTMVVDLSRDVEELWDNLNTLTRRHCRKSASLAARFHVSDDPNDPILRPFFERYAVLATEKGLRHLSQREVRSMIKGGNVIICYASTDRGVHSIHLVYNVRGSSIYLYSVRGADKSDESGKFVHWETIKHLKGAGQDWYDLCGVPSLDKDSGLYRFKAGFGGDLIDLGREFLFQSAAIRAARQLVRS